MFFFVVLASMITGARTSALCLLTSHGLNGRSANEHTATRIAFHIKGRATSTDREEHEEGWDGGARGSYDRGDNCRRHDRGRGPLLRSWRVLPRRLSSRRL